MSEQLTLMLDSVLQCMSQPRCIERPGEPATYDVIEVNLSAMVEILHCTETANYIRFKTQRCQKYASIQKSFK